MTEQQRDPWPLILLIGWVMFILLSGCKQPAQAEPEAINRPQVICEICN